MMLGCFIGFFKKLNQAFWLSSQVRKQGHQLPKFHLLDHQPLLNMQRWDKKTQRHVLMCPYLFKSPLGGHQSPADGTNLGYLGLSSEQGPRVSLAATANVSHLLQVYCGFLSTRPKVTLHHYKVIMPKKNENPSNKKNCNLVMHIAN